MVSNFLWHFSKDLMGEPAEKAVSQEAENLGPPPSSVADLPIVLAQALPGRPWCPLFTVRRPAPYNSAFYLAACQPLLC